MKISIADDTYPHLSGYAGSGISPVGEHWRLLPGVRYRMLSRDVEIGNSSPVIDLNYPSVGMDISRFF